MKDAAKLGDFGAQGDKLGEMSLVHRDKIGAHRGGHRVHALGRVDDASAGHAALSRVAAREVAADEPEQHGEASFERVDAAVALGERLFEPLVLRCRAGGGILAL